MNGRRAGLISLGLVLAAGALPASSSGAVSPADTDGLRKPNESGSQTFKVLSASPGRSAADECGTSGTVGWVCVGPEEQAATTAGPNRRVKYNARRRAMRRPLARAAVRYSDHTSRTVYYGIGLTQVGSFQRGTNLNFNGRQGQLYQSGNVLSGPALRYDFRETIYRGDGHDIIATEFQDIRPLNGAFSTGYVTQPTQTPYHHYNQYHIHFNTRFRASGVSNPSSGDGTFGAPGYNTDYYYCSSGQCQFP